jgi:hypothetical protein
MSSAKENFFKALNNHKEQEAKAEELKQQRGENTFSDDFSDFDPNAYLGLKEGKNINCFRLIGNPIEIKENRVEGDPVIFLESKVVRDTKSSYLKLRWPFIFNTEKCRYESDPDFILTKMLNKVQEFEYIRYTEEDINSEKGIRKTEEGKIVDKDNRQGFRKYLHEEFYPLPKVVFNALDRMDTWCKDNSSYKILASAVKPYKNKNGELCHEINVGLALKLYYEIFDQCGNIGSTWEEVDFVINKLMKINSAGKKQFDKYEVHDATDGVKYLGEEMATLASADPLTDDEQSYKKHDLKYMYKPTPYAAIDKAIAGLITMFDKEFGTNYFEELQEHVSREIEERKKEQAENTDKKEETTDKATPEKKEEVAEEKKEESVPVRREPVAEKTEEKEAESEDPFVKNFPAWAKLSEKEQKFMRDTIPSFTDDGVPSYVNKEKCPGCIDTSCRFINGLDITRYPEEINTCPMCGKSGTC